jgi:hypothetical protein
MSRHVLVFFKIVRSLKETLTFDTLKMILILRCLSPARVLEPNPMSLAIVPAGWAEELQAAHDLI